MKGPNWFEVWVKLHVYGTFSSASSCDLLVESSTFNISSLLNHVEMKQMSISNVAPAPFRHLLHQRPSTTHIYKCSEMLLKVLCYTLG